MENPEILPTKLYCKNVQVDEENAKELSKLEKSRVVFSASDFCDKKENSEKTTKLFNNTTQEELELKVFLFVEKCRRKKPRKILGEKFSEKKGNRSINNSYVRNNNCVEKIQRLNFFF